MGRKECSSSGWKAIILRSEVTSTKYCLITLETQSCDFSGYSHGVYVVEKEKDILELANQLAKSEYNGCENVKEFDNGESEYCEFNEGNLIVSVHSAREIPKEDYEVLKKYY